MYDSLQTLQSYNIFHCHSSIEMKNTQGRGHDEHDETTPTVRTTRRAASTGASSARRCAERNWMQTHDVLSSSRRGDEARRRLGAFPEGGSAKFEPRRRVLSVYVDFYCTGEATKGKREAEAFLGGCIGIAPLFCISCAPSIYTSMYVASPFLLGESCSWF